MEAVLIIGGLGSAWLIALVLRAKGMHGFRAWTFGSLPMPPALVATEIWEPTGWLPVVLVFGTLYGMIAAAVGVFFGWVIARERRNKAQQPNPTPHPDAHEASYQFNTPSVRADGRER